MSSPEKPPPKELTGSQIIADGLALDIPYETPDADAPPVAYSPDIPGTPWDSASARAQLEWANRYNAGAPDPGPSPTKPGQVPVGVAGAPRQPPAEPGEEQQGGEQEPGQEPEQTPPPPTGQ